MRRLRSFFVTPAASDRSAAPRGDGVERPGVAGPADLAPRGSGAPAPRDGAVRWLPPGAASGDRPAPGVPATSGPGPLARVGAVCARSDLRVVSGALGIALAQAAGGPGLALAWSGADPPAGRDRASSAGARRLAVGLREAGHAAGAAGRVVRVTLPAQGGEAAADARSPAFTHRHPPEATAIVVAGPRGAEIDELLASCDLLLLAVRPGADPDLVAMAADGLARWGRPVDRLDLPASPAVCALSRSGLALVPPLRAAVLSVLGLA